jgi:hypothetical protein
VGLLLRRGGWVGEGEHDLDGWLLPARGMQFATGARIDLVVGRRS